MMQKRQGILLAATMFVLLGSGCQSDKTNGNIKIYYSAIEDGDYYEDWASQLQEHATLYDASFDVGYAQNSVETQDAQIKNAAVDGCNVFLCGLVSPDTVTEVKAAAGDTPIVFINNAPEDRALEKDRYIYVASDEFMAGQYQAEYVLEKFGQKQEINVVILKGPKDASVSHLKGISYGAVVVDHLVPGLCLAGSQLCIALSVVHPLDQTLKNMVDGDGAVYRTV